MLLFFFICIVVVTSLWTCATADATTTNLLLERIIVRVADHSFSFSSAITDTHRDASWHCTLLTTTKTTVVLAGDWVWDRERHVRDGGPAMDVALIRTTGGDSPHESPCGIERLQQQQQQHHAASSVTCVAAFGDASVSTMSGEVVVAHCTPFEENEHGGVTDRRRRHFGGLSNVSKYHSYAEIIVRMHKLEELYPGLVNVFDIGSSFEEQPITALRISTTPVRNRDELPEIVLVGTQHAREWITSKYT